MISILNPLQLEEIYNLYMIEDFPENELKSCKMIKDLIYTEKSIAIGYYKDDSLIGYATVLIADRVLLLDYFAIIPEYRNQGYGTSFLKELYEYFNNYDAMLIEAEAADTAEAKKRLDFYYHSGCLDSGIRGILYFVDYVLLYKELSKTYSNEEIKKKVYETYHIVYPHFENTKYLIFH